jgi:hypothetical protein
MCNFRNCKMYFLNLVLVNYCHGAPATARFPIRINGRLVAGNKVVTCCLIALSSVLFSSAT